MLTFLLLLWRTFATADPHYGGLIRCEVLQAACLSVCSHISKTACPSSLLNFLPMLLVSNRNTHTRLTALFPGLPG